jgi:FtsZ-interacting cell division protein YlmF
MDAAAAQRLLDFVAGAVDAIDGNAERLGANSFLFTPHQVQVSRMDSAVE